MSKGMPSRKAFDAAVAVARARGQVIFLQAGPDFASDFLVITPYGIIAVCVRRTRRIRTGIDEIAYEYRETLNLIRAADTCPGMYCEFWLWSPYGAMRFFQIEGFRLTEISLTGLPLVPAVTGKFAGQPGNCTKTPGIIPGIAPAGQRESPENVPGGATGQKNPAAVSPVLVPARPAPAEPHYIRFLRRRNAGIQRKKEEARAAGGEPGARPSPVLPGPGEGGSPAEGGPPGRAFEEYSRILLFPPSR
jgi:hypothetical protein